MKNLKKLNRNDLKLVKGSGGGFAGEGLGGGCGGDYFPVDPPMPGEPYNCSCNSLAWCEKMAACVHMSFYSPENCRL
ncbi:hypothetical protein FY557_18900 [Chryseobacterium sp. SN22]|uniref:bacteriocin-like protein n=1 Tax=Chryseobacterium sp. SN22 TaxID=2606431 RepID=UPI0011EC997F|nr:hypothetical protein [Chryseobacterium sp. SN22]KAA0126138.1 hypothetical protein FY557_18900 [Chryseobacterium sp. SN22]